MTEQRQFNVTSTGMEGVVRLSTAVPLDDPEIHNRHLIRDLGRDQAVVLAAQILEAAGVEYMIEVSMGARHTEHPEASGR